MIRLLLITTQQGNIDPFEFQDIGIVEQPLARSNDLAMLMSLRHLPDFHKHFACHAAPKFDVNSEVDQCISFNSRWDRAVTK